MGPTREVRADVLFLLERLDALLAERDKYQALWYETARMVHEERERQAQAAPVLAAADRLASTTAEWDTEEGESAIIAVLVAVAAWRAAREG